MRERLRFIAILIGCFVAWAFFSWAMLELDNWLSIHAPWMAR